VFPFYIYFDFPKREKDFLNFSEKEQESPLCVFRKNKENEKYFFTIQI
jgi:hypothetical protein